MRQLPVATPKFDNSPSKNRLLSASLEPFPVVQAHSSSSPTRKPVSCHPQIAQGKQRKQLRRGFGKTPVANLGEPEQALDHPKGMLHLGATPPLI